MTPVQQARLTGLRASLEQRGVWLTTPGGRRLRALIEIVVAEAGAYALEPELRNAAIVHVVREDLAGETIAIGDSFAAVDPDQRYRVTRIEDQPVNVAIRFHTELD